MSGRWIVSLLLVAAMLLSAMPLTHPADAQRDQGLGSLSAYDLSVQPFFPPIGDQDGGTCAAWAITYYARGYMEAKANGWTDASTGNVSHLFSPYFTYNRVHGDWMTTTMAQNRAVLVSVGAATEDVFPYNASDLVSIGSASVIAEAGQYKANACVEIAWNNTNPDATFSRIRALVSEDVPVTFGLDSQCFMWSGLYNYGGAVGDYLITASDYNASHWPNHAGCIVGYDNAKSISGQPDVGAFKVANSWGATFGDHGFYWIPYDAMRKVGLTDPMLTYVTGNGTAYVPPQSDDNGGSPIPDDNGGSTIVTPTNGGGGHTASGGTIRTSATSRTGLIVIAPVLLVSISAVLLFATMGNGWKKRKR